MGWVKSITKVFKKIVKGVKTGFKSILKPFGKLMKNKLFKGIMLAVTIWTGVGAIITAGMTSAGTWSLGQALSAGAKYVTSLPGKILSAPGKILTSVKDGITGAVDGARNILTPTAATNNTGLTQGLDAAGSASETIKAAGAAPVSAAPDVAGIVEKVANGQAAAAQPSSLFADHSNALGMGNMAAPQSVASIPSGAGGMDALGKLYEGAQRIGGGLLSKGGDALEFMNKNAEGLNFASQAIAPMFEMTPEEQYQEYLKQLNRQRGRFSDEQIAAAGNLGYGYGGNF